MCFYIFIEGDWGYGGEEVLSFSCFVDSNSESFYVRSMLVNFRVRWLYVCMRGVGGVRLRCREII